MLVITGPLHPLSILVAWFCSLPALLLRVLMLPALSRPTPFHPSLAPLSRVLKLLALLRPAPLLLSLAPLLRVLKSLASSRPAPLHLLPARCRGF